MKLSRANSRLYQRVFEFGHPVVKGVVVGSANQSAARETKGQPMIAATCRLRKHADYQCVYSASRKQFGKQMSYFFLLRSPLGPDGSPRRDTNPEAARVGLTVGKVIGKAVDRNRIKRRMREAVRRQLSLLPSPVDVVLHPRRSVIDLDFATLEREVGSVFRAIQRTVEKQAASSRQTVD